MSVSSHQRVTVPPDVMVREVSGEAFLLHIKSERYFGLDATGTHMLRVLEESGSIEEAAARLRSEYDVDAETLQADLDALIARLLEHGLIHVGGPDGAPA